MSLPDARSYRDAFIGWWALKEGTEREGSVTPEVAEDLATVDRVYQAYYSALGACVYGQREIVTVVAKLIDGAIPYSGSKGKILVLPCSDPRSLQLQNWAQELVDREDFTNATYALSTKELTPREQIWKERLGYLIFAYAVGLRPNEIAETWIRWGWVRTNKTVVTPEGEVVKAPWYKGDHLATGTRLVRKGRAMLRERGFDLKHGRYPLQREPD